MVDAANGDFTLKSTTAAIDEGKDVGLTQDCIQVAREILEIMNIKIIFRQEIFKFYHLNNKNLSKCL